jgi:hypothetical protein
MNMQCTAKSKQSGERCKKDAVAGFQVCHIHGGKSLVGIASPNFKTGRHSKFLPENLQLTYEEVANDPELLSVRGEIHLIDALIASKLSKLDDNESAATWKRVDELIRNIRKAYKKEDYGGLEDALEELVGIADKKRLFYATEQELTAQMEQRRKLVETENKALYNKERAITVEQAMLLMSALLDSVRRNVKDANALRTIQSDFWQLTSMGTPQTISVELDGGN